MYIVMDTFPPTTVDYGHVLINRSQLELEILLYFTRVTDHLEVVIEGHSSASTIV